MKKLICLICALMLVFALVGCNDEMAPVYEQAVAAMENGKYAEAYPLLVNLGDYKDAKALLATIHAEKVSAEVETAGVTMNVDYTLKNGNVVKEVVTVADGSQLKNYYKFNANGLCTSEILGQADGGKVNINHFYEGNVIVRTVRTNASGLKDTYVYTCDTNGRIAAHTLTFSDGSVQEGVYNYNELGQLVKLECTGAGEETIAYEYNEHGDVYQETVTSGDSQTVTTYIYTYAFTVK